MTRCLIGLLGISLIVGFGGRSAQSALVTYDFVDVGTGPILFTGSFTFDTITTAISNETLQSSGGATENWVATNGTTFNGGTTYAGAPIIAGFDLFFASQSALFPTSDGDIVEFSLFNPLDGVSGDAIVGSYEIALSPLGAFPVLIGDNAAIRGCVAPTGVAIIVGQDPGEPTCALAAASVPEPSSLALVISGLLSLGWRRWARRCRSV
jgi:hypothetical protein